MTAWKTHERRTVFTHPFINLELHTVELPDGRVIQDWPWVDTPEYINVLPETTTGEYLVFRQTKYALDSLAVAPVGGFIEPGEPPLEAAKRELREETGYEAEAWISLGTYAVDMNRGAGKAHLFFARGARYAEAPVDGDLEVQELLHLRLPEIHAAMKAGEFKGLAWVSLIALALHHIKDDDIL
jgi:ADP-ribose pyrophosphatase